MFKTLKYRYVPSNNEVNILKLICFESKKLYNDTLFMLRQNYFKNKKVIELENLYRTIKKNKYERLNFDTYINVIKNVHIAFLNFMKGFTSIPKYIKQNGYYQIFLKYKFDSKMCNYGYVKMNIQNSNTLEYILIKIPKIIYDKKIIQLKIIPSYKCLSFTVAIIYYEKEKRINTNFDDKIMAIDLGINNLATCVVSDNSSFIIDGKYLKSINHFYNKRLAYLKSKKPFQTSYTRMEYLITQKRNRKIADAINKASRQIVDYVIDNKINEIVIGYNKGFKSKSVSIENTYTRKKVNQNIVQIPLIKLKNRIEYLCKVYGIKCSLINESYTSVCSFYDNEHVGFHYKYIGKRISRSLFCTGKNIIVNADVNGALNILKKCKTDRDDIISFLRNRGQTIPMRKQIKLS